MEEQLTTLGRGFPVVSIAVSFGDRVEMVSSKEVSKANGVH
ncbi:hypothetical protein N44_00205 [Microcystis aeruginosa NIES-44]|uniref:Uncharacterized protein n=1 Tax=Microcystis aeruginosa NIES-44 TaxID=449439 RepID=A0A0A1VQ60_MICAE|nr:hypothetical protein N44_00205 [Microcystis aeruginosa NIES-44]